MYAVSSSQNGSDAASRNSAAINADIVRQLEAAPVDLRQAFRSAGYDGVVRWSARWMDLCDTVLRIHWLGLMVEETRQKALTCCDRCVGLNIPNVDIIGSQAERIRTALGA